MKICLDTNVLVSAFATRGLCADLFESVLLGHDLVLGHRIIDELHRSLQRKLRLTPAIAQEIVTFASGEASEFVTKSRPVDARVSRADALVLGEAIAGRAEVFVTGDRALLKLGGIQGMRIVSPRGLWELLQANEP